MGFKSKLRTLLPQVPAIAFEALTGNQKGAALAVVETMLRGAVPRTGDVTDAVKTVAVATDDLHERLARVEAQLGLAKKD